METYGIPRQIDMKLVVYTNPISVYIIPVLYGFVIARLSAFIERNCERMSRCLSYVGSITIPIMFLHEPLNRFCLLSNYLLIYLLTINEQIQNIAQKKDTLCRRMYN